VLGDNDARLGALASYLEGYREQQMAEIEQALRFAHELPRRVALAIIPALEPGVRDLRSLAAISSTLTNSTPGRQFLDNAADALGIAVLANAPARRSAR